MSFGFITSDAFTIPPKWISGNLNIPKSIKMVDETALPAPDQQYGCGNYVFQQDGAPSQTSKATQKYLVPPLGSKGFWAKSMWPPSSLNLNPLDFFVSMCEEEKARAKPHPRIATLKHSVNKQWVKMSANEMVAACQSFC